MTPREKIETLLAWYVDVLNSWADEAGDGSGVTGRHPALHDRSYRELERLLPLLKAHNRKAYNNLAQRYWRAPQAIVLRCPRCGPKPETADYGVRHVKDDTMPAFKDHHGKRNLPRFHVHGRDPYQLRPVTVRVPSEAIETPYVTLAVGWLEENWRGVPEVPTFEPRKVLVA